MGKLLQIYLLENMAMISILRFFRIGMIYEDIIKGIFIGIWKYDIQLSIGLFKPRKITEVGNA
jgi:hypothetical protein|tara:strand:- start:1505 stop:1693 length:189 start_codon:yes stop_codon:yes gene_type:complete